MLKRHCCIVHNLNLLQSLLVHASHAAICSYAHLQLLLQACCALPLLLQLRLKLCCAWACCHASGKVVQQRDVARLSPALAADKSNNRAHKQKPCKGVAWSLAPGMSAVLLV
jgi:hypothetical protein